ncbi:MAG: ATP-binding protein [Candidatus Tectomicrobia bacterium]|uniref:ATP-binding protein n=1 Tax=Tectimicrobiota bacterium TaxID=2528274 RepID=A0A932GNB3_UNCTE|nr:ATP-binding protein [Candidatus Tectomicrobia bacterium]
MIDRAVELITAQEFEMVTSSWDPEKWARFCNTLIASYAEGLKSEIGVQGQIYAPDGGIDAELVVHEPDLHEDTFGLLGPGKTVYQFKKRDVSGRNRNEIIAKFKGKEEAEKIARGQEVPDRYVFLTNVELQRKQRESLKHKIQSGFGPKSPVAVRVFGAAELTALVLNRPHLQQIFFARGPFYSYEEARQMHIRASRAGEIPPFVGREEILKELTAVLLDPQCRVIVLYGPPEVGKSRLCLEARKSQEWRARSAWASDPFQVSAEDLRRLEPPKNVVFVVLEDLDEQRAEELARHASIREHLKLIITSRRPVFAKEPFWVRQLEVSPLEDHEAARLIREESGRRLSGS